MKINFILPFTSLTGGIKVIFEYANRLNDRGHDVICYVPMLAYRFNNYGLVGELKRFKSSVGNTLKRRTKVDWFDLKVPIKLVPSISDIFIRDADVTIATAWPTAYSVNKLNISKGEKYYFIQHYEIWSGPKELVDGSYKLPLKRIVIAKWLKDLMENEFKVDVTALIPNGINLNEFFNDNKVFNKEKIILMMYHNLEWKGYKDGLKAFEIVRRKHPELKLRLFGLKKGNDIPEYAEFYENPSRNLLRRLYSTSDIFVSPSWTEGWHLPPMEAMACKCAVVATNVGCIPDIGIHRETAMVCEPRDIQGLANNILELVENEELLKKISFNGFEKIRNYTWDNSTDLLEKVLMSK
ncbi:hypothetical protein SAMN04324257_01343 [Thermoanaerobacter thermohydrosulfuricus]|jgi:hypothetical protein|nr:hypothetical protein SAMN04324257_01343 [Thermoanaerobacter thermohydrosulfuricus]